MGINDTGSDGGDPTIGTGPEKRTTATPGTSSAETLSDTRGPNASGQTGADGTTGSTASGDETVGTPDPQGGGCMKLGWGCLPVIAAVAALPGYLFF